jgi:tetratricopeptide (TPR) repeat protein
LAALVAGGLCLHLAASPQRSPRQWLEHAIELHRAGRLEQAVEEYLAFLKQYPQVADVYSNLGAAYAGLGNLPAALEAYRKAIDLGTASDLLTLYVNLGLAYFKSGRFEEAARSFREALRLDPDRYQAALLLAECELRAGRYREVETLLQPFEDRYGEDPALISLLGTALIKLGETFRGQVLIDRIFRKGESVEAHIMLGTAHVMAADWPNAALEFEKALKLDPRRPTVNSSYGLALREMSRPDEAAVYFRRELELNPFDFEANLFLGIYLYKHLQEYDEALQLFQRALGVRPGDVDVRYHMGLVYLLQEDQARALELLEGVVREVPGYMEGHVALARIYFRLGRREEAQREREIVERLRAERDAATPKAMTGGDGVPERR